MRLLLVLLLLLVAGFTSWRLGWIGDAPNMESLDKRIASTLETERLRLTVPTLAPDAELLKWVDGQVQSGSATDPNALAVSARHVWPQYQDVRVLNTYSMFADGVLDRVETWQDGMGRELTHVCVVTKRGTMGIGWHATVLAGLRFPVFSPEALDDPKQSKFYATCTLCNAGQPCEIPRRAHRFKMGCHQCGKVYAMLAADTAGKFRHVTEFLKGYAPPAEYPPGQPKLAELMDIWRAETGRCKYVPDVGTDDDDSWQTAEETVALGQGDCEDSAILLADWLLTRGFQARVAIGYYDEQRTMHAWVVVRLDGNDYVLESTEFPFALQRPPLLGEVNDYIAELLFDREALYIPKRPDVLLKGDLWGEDSWHRVETKRPKAVEVSLSGE